MDELNNFIDRHNKSATLNTEVKKSKTYFEKLSALRKYYTSIKKETSETFEYSKLMWQDVYPIDWHSILTPIEWLAWCCIRNKGSIVLYPQYPVDSFFVDFGNPGLKIALELDGKEFHDFDKDCLRDEKLKSLGWTVYRITGKEMYRSKYNEFSWDNCEDYDDDCGDNADKSLEIYYWLKNTGDGVIEAIKNVHFINAEDGYFPVVGRDNFLMCCHSSLNLHKN